MSPDWIVPDWEAPPGVCALATTRAGGASVGRHASLNLGAQVGDDPRAVAANRASLAAAAGLPTEPLWLHQVHGKAVAAAETARRDPEADAAVTRTPGHVLAVLTADCLPVLLAARDGRVIGIAHAGWRGLAAGVVEATLAAMDLPGAQLVAWLGPAIGPKHYRVGAEVRAAFRDTPGAGIAFSPAREAGHWQCDLAALARARLLQAGVSSVSGGAFCTYDERERFYSFRRDGETGRMASLIWRTGR